MALGLGKFGEPSNEDVSVGRGRDSETLELISIYRRGDSFILKGETSEQTFVVYQAQYDSPEFGSKPIFVRPVQMFLEIVKKDDYKGPRFRYVGEA